MMKFFKFVSLALIFIVSFLFVNLNGQVITLKKDSTYSEDLNTTLTPGDNIYIQLDGVEAWHAGANNDNGVVSVIVKNISTGDSITVPLTESLENVFRGVAKITNITDNTNNYIKADVNDRLLIKMVGANITEDGLYSDWTNVVFHKIIDVSDATNPGSPDTGHDFSDITNVYFTSDDTNLYILYEMKSTVDCGSNYYLNIGVVIDMNPTDGTNGGDWNPWWIWVDNAPTGSGYPNNGAMLAEYVVHSFYAQTTTAGGGYFGSGSTVNLYHNNWNEIVCTNKPVGGFPGDYNKTIGNYIEVKLPFAYISNPTNWIGLTVKEILADSSWALVGYDLVPDDNASPHHPVWVRPSAYVRTFVNITASPITNISTEVTTTVTNNDLSKVVLYPTIIKGDKRLVIDNMPVNGNVKIFTLSGELVAEISTVVNGKAEWDFSSLNLAHGLYIAYITDGNGNMRIERFIYEK